MQYRALTCATFALFLVTSVSACKNGSPDQHSQGSGSHSSDAVFTGVLDEASFAALHELTDAVAPAPLGRTIQLGDGSTAYLSAAGKGRPGVIVIHEWWGLNDHIKHWTDRLAAAGYNALAVDLYRGAVATTRDEAMAAMGAVVEANATATMRAAALYLASETGARKYATIGWCFGGAWSLRTALDQADLDACVMYYGRTVTDVDELRGIRAPLLGVFGNNDRSIPPDVVDAFDTALDGAGVRHRILRYDADHAFANPSSARYDAVSATAAWDEVSAFLAAELE